jgi:ATP-dependent helicase/nuclease subunit A
MSALTSQQQEAVYRRDVSVVLSSGAGCGKTHVLTERYLSYLREDGAEVNQIVAITFTERAARQMRGRIRQAVLRHVDEAQADDAVQRWERHLRGLETAQISTIHAFCANLLRQFAVEAGIDPRFEVLEDFLAVNFENDALLESLQELLTTTTAPAHDDLRSLVLLYGWRPVVESVRYLLHSWQPAVQRRWSERPTSEIAAEWQDSVRLQLLPRYLAYLESASPKIARCLWLLRTVPCSGPKMAANVATVLQLMPHLAEASDLGAVLDQVKGAARVVGTERAKAWSSEEVYDQIRVALEGFRAELPKKLELFLAPAADLEAAAVVGQRFLRVTEVAALAYRQLKRRHGVLDFQDLLIRARDLLRDHAVVRERIQRRYRFLMIDELQDTDPVQIELVQHLAGAALTTGKLFAVGDHSQSIYRFRGADVEQFQFLRGRMPFDGRLGLTVNFRSQPEILKFVNALVQGALEDYQPLQAHRAQVNPGPCVEFLWTQRGEADVTTGRQLEAESIALRIAHMVRGAERLVVGNRNGHEELRPVQPGDIVLLFRAMTNVEIYEAALRRHGLNYYLIGGRAFFAQQEIYDLLNLLRALENPHDSVCLAGTLRSPFCSLSDEALFVLARHRDGLWAGLRDPRSLEKMPAGQRGRVERAHVHLDRWRSLKNRLPIARLLAEVLADSGFDAALQFEFLGDRKLANLWKLMDLARDYDRSGLFGLAEFVARLDDLVESQSREEQAATQPENADVIRLMSIHQAKGLEFPVVILPDFGAEVGAARRVSTAWHPQLGCVVKPPDEEPLPFPDIAWKFYEAAEEVADWREDLRTLYVACTRAEDYLILSSALPAPFAPNTPWLLTLAERFDLTSGRCLAPDLPAEQMPKVATGTSAEQVPDANGRCRREPPPFPGDGHLATLLGRADAGSATTSYSFQWDAEDGSDRIHWPLRPK